MDRNRNEIIAGLKLELSGLKDRMADLETRLTRLELEEGMAAEHIDLEHEDILPDMTEVVETPAVAAVEETPSVAEIQEDMPAEEDILPEDMPEDVPAADEESGTMFSEDDAPQLKPVSEEIPETSVVEDLPETDESVEVLESEPLSETQELVVREEDLPESGIEAADIAGEEDTDDSDGGSLFGEFEMEAPAAKNARPVKTVNDANSSRVHKTIGEARTGSSPAWLTDIPGPEVKDIRSAISLNDRVMFISSLFREDSMLFQDVVSRINSMSSVEKAAAYLKETFPEWNMDSELVYRFMMAVRRKIR